MKHLVLILVVVGLWGCGPYEGYTSYDDLRNEYCNKYVSDFDFYEKLRKTSTDVISPLKALMLARKPCPDPPEYSITIPDGAYFYQ